MKSIYVLGLLVLSTSLSIGCSSTTEGNGSPITQAPDADGNTVHMDKLKAQQVIGGCTIQLSGASSANGTTACVDFVQTPNGDMTTNKVSMLCSQMQGRSDFVMNCPTTNVNAICRLTITGAIGYVMLYNDNIDADLKNFATNCAKQGGQVNP